MTTKFILTDDTAYTIKTQMPSEWEPFNQTVTVTVGDKAGNDLVDSQSATVATADTTDGAILAGAAGGTLTTGTMDAGQLWAFGSDDQGWQIREIESYVVSTKAFTIHKRFNRALVDNSDVRALDMSYTVDASATAWDNKTEVEVLWEPSGDFHPMTELWEVRKTLSSIAGLEDIFSDRFNHLYIGLVAGSWDTFRTGARDRLTRRFDQVGRNFNLIVDSEIATEITLLEIALMIARGVSIDEAVIARLEKDYEYEMEILNALDIWIDDNEDEIEDDDETQQALTQGIQRGLL